MCYSVQEARRIAQTLLERRLIAASHISEQEVGYWWEGQQNHTIEWEMSCITKADNFSAIKAVIEELHSYELPMIITVPIIETTDQFASWINQYSDGRS
jgi:periplasmic divalent cation tolerance protein